MRRFEQRLRPLGFGMAYLPAPGSLAEDKALLQKELAKRAHVEQPTMAALFIRMERDGLTLREPHPSDGWARQLVLTERAKTVLPEAKWRLEEVAELAASGFSESERATLLALLRRAVENFGESEEA